MQAVESSVLDLKGDYDALCDDVRGLRDTSIGHGKDIGNLIETNRENRSMFRTILGTVIAACIIGLGTLAVAVAVMSNRINQNQSQSQSFSAGPEWIDTVQMAASVGVDTETLRERARQGKLPADAVSKTSANGEWRFRRDAADEIMAAMNGGGS